VQTRKKDLMRKLNRNEKNSFNEIKNRLNIWDDYVSESPKKKKEYEPIKNNEDKFVMKSPGTPKVRPEQQIIELTHPEEPFRLNDATEENHAWLGDIESKINYRFKNRNLLATAFTHRSALGNKNRVDYERLEFLGDAVLDLVMAQLLCDQHKEAQEGDLSKMRAALVNTITLSEIAKKLNFSNCIKMGRSEFSSGGANRPSILADVVEAAIGAVFSDGGYMNAFQVIRGLFGDLVKNVVPSDPKTELQEALCANGSEPPQYLLKRIEGPEHSPNFVTVVIVDGEVVGFGNGATKKGSQQAAAAFALKRITKNTEVIPLKSGQTEIIESLLNYDCSARSETSKLDKDTY
jgi:ribonuclease-3